MLSDGEWSMFKQAWLIYQPTIQPTNRPPFPHSPNMPKPQPPIHSFPLTRNSGTHKQVSPPFSSHSMVAKFQLVQRSSSVNEYWGRKSLQSSKIVRHYETKNRVRRTVNVNHSSVTFLQSSLPFVLSSHISCGFPPKNAFPGHPVRPVQVHRWPTTLFSALLPLILYCWKGTENEGESNFVLIWWRASCVLCASPEGTNYSIIGWSNCNASQWYKKWK